MLAILATIIAIGAFFVGNKINTTFQLPIPTPNPIKFNIQASPTQTPNYPPQQIQNVSPTALCNDGTYSYSADRSGACSHHDGVSVWYIPSQKTENARIIQDPKIDCIGPDGKHLQITQKACDDFNAAWEKPQEDINNSTSGYAPAYRVAPSERVVTCVLSWGTYQLSQSL